jgi:hypothetical protein
MLWMREINDPTLQTERVRLARHGVIETAQGRLVRVTPRPWPKIVSLPEVLLWGGWVHRRRRGDRCLLYYSQPRRFPNFLALRYVVSGAGTQLATFRRALVALDEIAALKRVDAIVTDASNRRISERLLARWGWEPNGKSRWHRPYIKRLYGKHSASGAVMEADQPVGR